MPAPPEPYAPLPRGIAAERLDVPSIGTAELVARAVSSIGDGGAPETAVDALAGLVLAPEELEIWRRLPPSPRRRRQWLFGRLAAKDVASALVEADVGVAVRPRDLVVATDRRGAPFLVVRDPGAVGLHLVVSIAHSGEGAMAMGTSDHHVRGVGIDVEVCRPRRALERKGLTPRERELLAEIAPSRRTEVGLRWWCAKEAAVKALGVGLDLAGGAQAIAVTSLRDDQRVLRVELTGSPTCPARTLVAATRRDGDLILATVVDGGDAASLGA